MNSASSVDNRPINSAAVQALVRQLLHSHANKTLNGLELENGLIDILSNSGIDHDSGTSGMEQDATRDRGHPLQSEPPLLRDAETSNHPEPPTNEVTRGEKGVGKRLRPQSSWSSGECNDKKHRKHDDGDDEDENDGGGPGPSNYGKRPQDHNGGYTSLQRRGGQGKQNGRFQGRTDYRKYQEPSYDDPATDDIDDQDDRPPPDCGGSAISRMQSVDPIHSETQGSIEEWTSAHWESLEPESIGPSKWESIQTRLQQYNANKDSFTSRWLNDTKFQASDYTPDEREQYWLTESRRFWVLGVWIGRLVENGRSGRRVISDVLPAAASTVQDQDNNIPLLPVLKGEIFAVWIGNWRKTKHITIRSLWP
jgi:hypothetical protein